MNPCKRFKDAIFNLLDGEVDSIRKKELEEHLKDCDGCSQFLESLRQYRSHLKSLTPIKCSENFQILMREKIRRDIARKGLSTSPFYSTRFRWVTAAGFAVILIVTGIWITDTKRPINEIHQHAESQTLQTDIAKAKYPRQIRYVAGHNPNRISISRNDGQDSLSASGDSLLAERQTENPPLNVTPVSF